VNGGVPGVVIVAAIGLLATGLLIGLIGGLIAGWMLRDRR
jgi:hypothetical protein